MTVLDEFSEWLNEQWRTAAAALNRDGSTQEEAARAHTLAEVVLVWRELAPKPGGAEVACN